MSFITQNIPAIGGLASQVQQYSSLLSVAKENNKEIIFPESMKNNGVGFQFSKILDIPIRFEPDSFFNDFETITLNSYTIVDENIFKLDSNRNYHVDGRFDLFHYWYPKYKDTVMNWSWNSVYYERAKKKFEAKKAKMEGKKSKDTDAKEEMVTDAKEDAPVDESDVMEKMEMGEESKEEETTEGYLNESFRRMQRIAGIIK